MIRSKADWIEYGEKNSSFFLKLENRNRQTKSISLLLDDSDKEIKGQKEILSEELRFYKTLYTQPLMVTTTVRVENRLGNIS